MPSQVPGEFIRKIPKTDLHLHLDGSIRISTLIELARQERIGLPFGDEQGLLNAVFKESYPSLPDYLYGFQYTTAVLNTRENLTRVACELAEDNLAEGVRYFEVRFAPQLHVRPGLPIKEVVRAVNEGLARARDAFNVSPAVRCGEDIPCEYGLVVCAMRHFSPEMSIYYRRLFEVMAHAPLQEVYAAASLELARAAAQMRDENLPVVGFDLAGAEAGYPAVDHRDAYAYAHSRFIRKTVHAGEAYGPESIFQAITNCHADRIGHGTHLFEYGMVRDANVGDPRRFVEHLAEYLASRRITIEVCLSSNRQTNPRLLSLRDHPMRRMLERNMAVTICTDNRLISRTTVTRELTLAADALDLSPAQFKRIVVAGFKGGFFPGTYHAKRAYIRQALDRYDRLAVAYGMTSAKAEKEPVVNL